MGWCGPPAWATLRRGVPAGELRPDNPVVAYHLRAEDGVAKLARGLAAHVAPPVDADDWHYLAQLTQARALTVGVDHLRALPRCSGVVLWQLQDCWPVISWSVIDDDERRKPSWYAVRAAFAPRRASIQPTVGGLVLALVNDTSGAWEGEALVRRTSFDGRVLAQDRLAVSCAADAVAHLSLAPAFAHADDVGAELLVVDLDGERCTWLWSEDKDLDLQPTDYDAVSEVVADGLAVTVTARTLLRDLALFPDRLLRDGRPLGPEAVVDDMLVTLLPGESRTFLVTGADATHRDAVTRPPVLRCIGDLAVARPSG